MNTAAVVWMHPGFEARERDLVEKGYTIRKMETGNVPCLYDEIPDMIIFSEELLSENSLFFKFNQFFPDAIALSIGTGIMAERVKETQHEASMDRLINEIKGIDTEE